MERDPIVVVAGILLVVSITATVLLWPTPVQQKPDKFHATLLLSDAEPNATDPSHLDAAIWVAVAGGVPKPEWTRVSVVAMSGSLCETLSAPVLTVDDLDQDGLLSERDVVHIDGLSGAFWNGTVTFYEGNSTIGSVAIHHGATTQGQPPRDDRDQHRENNRGALRRQGSGDDRELRETGQRGLLLRHDLP